jgi:hypothetical protein
MVHHYRHFHHKVSIPIRQTPARDRQKTGFVVWIYGPKRVGFLHYSETACGELSPLMGEGWVFETPRAAANAVARSFGPEAEIFGMAVFPVQP